VGTSFGSVSIADISTHRMMVVQRISCGAAPVTQLAASVTPGRLAQVASALGPRAADGGGVLPAPVGLAWDQQQQQQEGGAAVQGAPRAGLQQGPLGKAKAPRAVQAATRRAPELSARCPALPAGDAATLVVATEASGLRVFQAQHVGEGAWVQTSSASLPGTITGLGLTGSITGSLAGQHIVLQLSPDPGPPAELCQTSPGHILLMDVCSCSTVHRWHVLGAPHCTQLLPTSGVRIISADLGCLQQVLEVQLLTCTSQGGPCVLSARLPFDPECKPTEQGERWGRRAPSAAGLTAR
jgi:hypothetical protein